MKASLFPELDVHRIVVCARSTTFSLCDGLDSKPMSQSIRTNVSPIRLAGSRTAADSPLTIPRTCVVLRHAGPSHSDAGFRCLSVVIKFDKRHWHLLHAHTLLNLCLTLCHGFSPPSCPLAFGVSKLATTMWNGPSQGRSMRNVVRGSGGPPWTMAEKSRAEA
ncbi:hypothetical protein BJY01DRAFT_226048 [Aspergillus pseudoustus]|uniref:Uncharacterized protein n=1 Tax=Aspergillus pseudoustus TaxID=1810923 RepID=A0ABR4IX07_9EURO